MNILDFRLRSEGEKLVLQVLEQKKRGDPYWHYDHEATWRDARVEDLLPAIELIRAYGATNAAGHPFQSSLNEGAG